MCLKKSWPHLQPQGWLWLNQKVILSPALSIRDWSKFLGGTRERQRILQQVFLKKFFLTLKENIKKQNLLSLTRHEKWKMAQKSKYAWHVWGRTRNPEKRNWFMVVEGRHQEFGSVFLFEIVYFNVEMSSRHLDTQVWLSVKILVWR